MEHRTTHDHKDTNDTCTMCEPRVNKTNPHRSTHDHKQRYDTICESFLCQ